MIFVIVIILQFLSCGCIQGIPLLNNTSSTQTNFSITNRPNSELPDTFPVSGQVLLDDILIKGANIDAVSFDGTDKISTITNDSGIYVLYIKPDICYKVSATYMDHQYTIWPIFLSKWANVSNVNYNIDDKYKINLTYEMKSRIEGNTAWDKILVMANPVNNGTPVTAVSGKNGDYFLEVEPNIQYNISAGDYYGQTHFVISPHYHNYVYGPCYSVKVGPNETVLLDIDTHLST